MEMVVLEVHYLDPIEEAAQTCILKMHLGYQRLQYGLDVQSHLHLE